MANPCYAWGSGAQRSQGYGQSTPEANISFHFRSRSVAPGGKHMLVLQKQKKKHFHFRSPPETIDTGTICLLHELPRHAHIFTAYVSQVV